MKCFEYLVYLKWDGNVGSEVKVREFIFYIDMNMDGYNKGLNLMEYFLVVIGGCLIVNWGRLIKKMCFDVKGFEVEVRGWCGFDEF